MTKLWQLLTSELGSAFKNQYGTAGGTSFLYWAKELSCFSETQIVAGFNKFKKSGKTYMSLNILRNHCKPNAEDVGIDDFEKAFQAVIYKKWEEVHPAFQHLCREHRYALRQQTDQAARRAFKPIYDDVVKRISQGEKFERIVVIEQKPSGTKPFGRERGKATMKELLKSVGSVRA